MAIFAVLCACGHNIRKILAHLRALLTLLIAALLAPLKHKNSARSGAVTA
jgi:transposase, IS5 family